MSVFNTPPGEVPSLSNAGGQQGPGRSAQHPPFQVDESRMVTSYANFCRIAGTYEEVFIDFGLHLQPLGPSAAPIIINQRIVMNYSTAKRLLQVLQLTIHRYETSFGPVEIDVQKRLQQGPAGPTGS